MLEKIDLSKKLMKKEYDVLTDDLSMKLANLQRQCKEAGIPIMVLFEGWGASGKGTLINHLIAPLDPRGFKVFTIQKALEEESLRPFLWRFWTKTPAKGRIHIFDRSWYRRVLFDRMEKTITGKEVQYAFGEIVNFEKQLIDDGMIIVKFFLHISQKEQSKRLEKLQNSKESAWRVTKQDWTQNKHYDDFLKISDEMLVKTDTDYAPWSIVEANDREYAASKILSTVVERLKQALEENEIKKSMRNEEIHNRMLEKNQDTALTEEKEQEVNRIEKQLKNGVLNGVNLNCTMEKDEYKKKLKKLQEKLAVLHLEMYKNRIPLILAFEGWDAGGKGGAIRRVTQNLDPRGYEVIPIAAPNDIEKAHHYLWRFWNAIPKAGHLAIFDRTWYGRVMVERIEGFCSPEEWKRAYNEINHMEEHLANAGCIVIKFWLHIDKEEQERRFTERMNTPEKQWKITDEDWRNREKWDQYEEAVDELIVRTSTNYAPWVIVEANSKYYARIKVLETVVNALEERLKTLR